MARLESDIQRMDQDHACDQANAIEERRGVSDILWLYSTGCRAEMRGKERKKQYKLSNNIY